LQLLKQTAKKVNININLRGRIQLDALISA